MVTRREEEESQREKNSNKMEVKFRVCCISCNNSYCTDLFPTSSCSRVSSLEILFWLQLFPLCFIFRLLISWPHLIFIPNHTFLEMLVHYIPGPPEWSWPWLTFPRYPTLEVSLFQRYLHDSHSFRYLLSFVDNGIQWYFLPREFINQTKFGLNLPFEFFC